MIIGKICAKKGTVPPPQITFSYVGDQNANCSAQWTETLICQDCCSKIHTTINSTAVQDDGFNCCFQVSILIEEGFLCGANKIRIIDAANPSKQYFESGDNSLHVGLNTFVYCMRKEDITGSNLSIKIQIKDNSSNTICETNGVINACSQITTPCTPDYYTSPWMPSKIGYVTFTCPPPSSFPCYVSFTYTYRTVIVGGVVQYRDVQVLSYSYPLGCNCEDEKIKQMLEEMWKNPTLISAFKLSDETAWDPITGNLCFNNFRVITTDCWTTTDFSASGGPIIKTKCDKDTCCYAIYKVCYHKDENGTITYISNSYTQLNYDYVPVYCQTPCVSLNCHPWISGDGISGKSSFGTNELQNNESLCNVYIKTGRNPEDISVNLECEYQGKVTMQLIDLLGNVIQQRNIEKNSYHITIPLDMDLNSGMYFLRIIVDGNDLYYNKINVIK